MERRNGRIGNRLAETRWLTTTCNKPTFRATNSGPFRNTGPAQSAHLRVRFEEARETAPFSLRWREADGRRQVVLPEQVVERGCQGWVSFT